MAINSGGFGREALGDPSGGGGPLVVLRARAVRGQVVRITFSEEPLHQSASGRYDALNPANYTLEATVGEVYGSTAGSTPTISAISVSPTVLQGPAVGLEDNTEWGVDVHVDKQFVVGLTYKVSVVNVRAKAGGVLTAPPSAEFPGIVGLAKTVKPRNDSDLTDIGNSLDTGTFIIDDSGDLASQGGLDSLRKRVFRRLSTTRGGFVWLPNYGLAMRLKEVVTSSQLLALKADVLQQLRQEPDVAAVDATLSLDQLGLLTISLNILRKTGKPLEITTRRLSDGTLVQ